MLGRLEKLHLTLQVGSQAKTNREDAVFTVHQVELAAEKYRQMLRAIIHQ
jgi:hypothetical protein